MNQVFNDVAFVLLNLIVLSTVRIKDRFNIMRVVSNQTKMKSFDKFKGFKISFTILYYKTNCEQGLDPLLDIFK